jgi:hypothetical protein
LPYYGILGKVTHKPGNASCAPQELQHARLPHWIQNSGTKNEHLAPQKCTAAAAVFAGGPEQSKPDERTRCPRATGPAAGRKFQKPPHTACPAARHPRAARSHCGRSANFQKAFPLVFSRASPEAPPGPLQGLSRSASSSLRARLLQFAEQLRLSLQRARARQASRGPDVPGPRRQLLGERCYVILDALWTPLPLGKLRQERLWRGQGRTSGKQ